MILVWIIIGMNDILSNCGSKRLLMM